MQIMLKTEARFAGIASTIQKTHRLAGAYDNLEISKMI